MKKAFFGVIGLVTLGVTVSMCGTLLFHSKLSAQFPMNDPNADYFIGCSGTMFALNTRENRFSDISGFFIASSPTDLQPFCNQEVAVSFTLRKFRGQGICIRSRECPASLSPVVDIHSISTK